jgi:mannose-6-phosphate isomerase
VTAQTTGERQLTLTPVPGIAPMTNQIRTYDWGSSTALAQLQSRTPSGDPEAELWMGAHPVAPSDLVLDDGGTLSLPDVVERFPEAVLGPAVTARFGARLPFLLKLLAISRPLSIQVHPDAARAELMFTPGADTPYVDAFHKPELVVALEPVEALYGFRPAAEVAELIERLESDRLAGVTRRLRAGRDDASLLHEALATLLGWPMADRAALVAEIAAGSRRVGSTGVRRVGSAGVWQVGSAGARQVGSSGSGGHVGSVGAGGHADAFRWLDRLIGLHPADPMVLAPLLFDLIRLAPGQSLFVAAGMPHCYLTGLAVEILAASDNVLRAGLTSKPVALEELLQVIDCRPPESIGTTMITLGPNEVAWRPDIEDFQLGRIVLHGDEVAADDSFSGPQIVVCARGHITVRAGDRTLRLTAGHSAFVSAEAGPLVLGEQGEAFRGAVALPLTA